MAAGKNITKKSVRKQASRKKKTAKETGPVKSRSDKSSETSVNQNTSNRIDPEELSMQWSEERYRLIIGAISDGVAVLDRQWKYVLVNKALTPMIGKSIDELLGNRIMDVFPDVEESVFFKTFRRVMKTGKSEIVNDAYTFEDGRKGWFEVHVYPVHEGIFIIVSDITKRKKAEEEQKRLRVRMEALWEIGQMVDAGHKTICNSVLSYLVTLTQSQYGFYGFLNKDESVMRIHSWSKEAMKDCGMHNKPVEYPVEKSGVWGNAIRERRTLIINNMHEDHPFKKGLPRGHIRINRLMVVPVFRDNRIIAVGAVANKAVDYTEMDADEIRKFMQNAQLIQDKNIAEAELERNRALLKKTGRMARVGGWEFDVDTLTLTWTEEMYRIHEVDLSYRPSVDEAIAFYTPESRPVIEEAVKRSIESGEPFNLELELITATGKRIWVHAIGNTTYQDGKPVKVAGTFQDISERKRTEKLILEKERLLKRSQEIAHLGSWELDLVSNILTWSDEVYRIFGLRPQEFGASYEAFLKAVHPDDRGAVDAAYSGSLKEGRDTYDIEHRIVQKSTGKIRYVHEKCEHIRDRDGRIIRSEGMVHDITDRKKAEEQIVSISKFPSENPNPVLRIDKHVNILYKNEAVSKLLKYVKLSEKDILKILPDNLKKLIMNSLDAGNPTYDLEVKIGERFYSYSILPVPENQYVNVYAIDVTDRKNAENELLKHRQNLEEQVEARTKELKDAYKQLKQEVTEKLNYQAEALRSAQLASIGELAAGVAHEINNPINGIINGAQILVNKTLPESKEHQMAVMVLKEGDRIANIVGNLLSFARESKQPKGPVHVLEIMTDTLALTEAQIRKEMIRLKVNIPASLPDVYAQPQQIEQVFLNIINNARYAMNKKYPSAHKDKLLSINGECVTVDDTPFVRVTFYDSGVGIPYENLGKVINPFFTTKPPTEGTGLGLSISHGIIDDHGGSLKLDSVVGEFTKVTVDLPVYNES